MEELIYLPGADKRSENYSVRLAGRQVAFVTRRKSGWFAELYPNGVFRASGKGETREAAIKAAVISTGLEQAYDGPPRSDMDRLRAWAKSV